jgi:hypothetical protein
MVGPCCLVYTMRAFGTPGSAPDGLQQAGSSPLSPITHVPAAAAAAGRGHAA